MTGCCDYGSELSQTTIVFSRWTLLFEFSRAFQNELSKTFFEIETVNQVINSQYNDLKKV
jgi:hypothetical protein